MNTKDDIRTEIKMLLLKRGWTQEKLAKEMGLKLGKQYSGNNLGNKLKGETIQYREIKLIADILGYDIEFIDRLDKKGDK